MMRGGAGDAFGLGALDVDGGPFTGAVDHLAIAHCEHHVGTIAGVDFFTLYTGSGAGAQRGPWYPARTGRHGHLRPQCRNPRGPLGKRAGARRRCSAPAGA